MHPADFCECHIKASLSFMFLSNSALALLLGIPFDLQRQKVLDMDQLVFGQGEVVQIITSSVIVVLVFCLFLCRVVRCCRFSVSKVVAFIALAALSMLGACCLTTYGVGSTHCESGGSQNTPCYRRPDIDLPLTWFSVAISLAGVVSSSVLHLYDNAAHAWLRPESDGPRHLTQPTIRDSLELVKVQKYSNGNDPEQNRWVVPTRCPPPLYRPSPALLSSYILPSIPLRKRDMNKLGLTVITNIPMDSSSETPRKRWRGRGRDVWEKKLLGDSAKPEHK